MSEQPSQTSKPPYPREPQAYPGGAQEPGGPTPPYEGRGSGDKTEERSGVMGHDAGPRDVSDAERGGMTDTDMAPSGPLSGESTSTSGEDFGRGMSEEARKEERFPAGINAEPNVDPESPRMHPGDQGG